MTGNTELIEYGIQNEASDIRAHVCVTTERMYVYSTTSGVETIEKGDYRMMPAFQWVNGQSMKTAEGYLVPPEDIEGCITKTIPQSLIEHYSFDRSDSTSIKGNKAVGVVMSFIQAGHFPFIAEGQVIDDRNLQVSGTDIHVGIDKKIQVKCDYNGGPRELGGTGNLYLQVAECNPLGRH